jgi:hypothetical protein
MIIIEESKNIMRQITDREFLEYLHSRMLWKIVSRKEFTNWINKIDDGLSWKDVLKDFTNSSIFHLRVGRIITDVVDQNEG